MVTKITPKQSKRINALIKKLCCNCLDGNCLLLDDGEQHCCVQLISKSGIFCNYFKNAVLPADRRLYTEIMSKEKERNAFFAIHSSSRKQKIKDTTQTAPKSRNESKPPKDSAENERYSHAFRA
ncbi:MAG: cysteine-rich VLP domain-containing protein [Clostridiales bacterium]|nr:cysteine-rich VLP domain-containing protein [Clostridiales bacterium]